ncbi:MAG: response regulator transcription factor [Acidimicrobiales bacterium]
MRILVVEDEPNVASALQAGLSAEGFDVDIAADGNTGLWMAREHDYTVVVLDIMLPGRNGYQICTTLREEGNNTPILMLTAKDGDYDQAEGLDTGADDYLTKPFSFVVLTARIRALLRRGQSTPRDVQIIGDLEIDRDRRRIRRGDHEAELTHREFALLETLASDPGRVWSKDHLLDQVWGPDFDGGTNVVEVYVGYLRRKVQPDGFSPRIETVHGHGYRLIP